MKLFYFGSLLTAGSAILSSPAHGQTTVSIGPSVSLNLATAHCPEYCGSITFGYLPGLDAGVAATIGFGHFTLQPAIRYSQKGHKEHNTTNFITGGGSGVGQYDVNTKYQLGISLCYKIGEIDSPCFSRLCQTTVDGVQKRVFAEVIDGVQLLFF